MVKFNKKAPATVENIHDPIDVMRELTTLIHQQKKQVQKVLANATQKQSEIDGAVKTLAGLLKQCADLSFDTGIMKKVPTKITNPHGDVTMIEYPAREQLMLNIEEADYAGKVANELFADIEASFQHEAKEKGLLH